MEPGPRAQSLLIGLDGADLDVIHTLGEARLPNLFAQMKRGVHAALESVQPPATLPNWTTLLTGVDPGEHGVFDFTTRHGYRVRFSGGSVREVPTLAARLDRLGMTCAMLFFPATYPPEQLDHGVFISGWDAPVAFSGDASFVWPRRLHAEIKARFGSQRFDDVDEFGAGREGFHAQLPDALIARIERRTALGLWLLAQKRWDLFAIYFGESDTAAHHLWSLWDERSPRHPAGTTARERDGLARVYEALDHAVGRLLEVAGGEGVELSVVSDHGSGGSSDKVLYLNRALQQAGFLKMRTARSVAAVAARLKDAALVGLPPAVRERVFRAAGTTLPSLLESRVRFSAIDMAHTTLFSDELNYFPAIHYNLLGREPEGVLAPRDRSRVRRELWSALLALRDPDTQAKVVRALHAREDLYKGPHLERAPDLIVELELSNGYSYNLMPSAAAPDAGVFRRLQPHEYLGRKGRSLPGSHRPFGFYLAAGPAVSARGRIDAKMADASATLLARMGVAPPPQASGRVLPLLVHGGSARELPPVPHSPSGMADDARVAARLRSLGYIE